MGHGKNCGGEKYWEEMTFSSRLVKPLDIVSASATWTDNRGFTKEAMFKGKYTIETKKPIEVWECDCKHPNASLEVTFGDLGIIKHGELGSDTLCAITVTLPEGCMTIEVEEKDE